jgi:hypothetical protein
MAYTELAQRPNTRRYQPKPDDGQLPPQHRKAFRHPKTALGATGHWIHLATVAAPLVIAEVIKDSDKRWRAMRMVSVGAAIASEAAWTYRISKEREKDAESHEALENCEQQHCR